MQKNLGAKRRLSLKISSKYLGQWVVRPIVGIIIRESVKLERLLDTVRVDCHSNCAAAKEEILKKIGELEKSIDAIARETARQIKPSK
jgi:uncharacterized protein Yka (UPF0111/DUF47 family)